MNTTTEEISRDFLKNATDLGKCWAALRGNEVIFTVSMRVPRDVDFEVFRSKSIDMLELLGKVQTGNLYELEKEEYFLPRLGSHQNRSKKKPKTYLEPIKIDNKLDDKPN